jgi:hypothetical protein
MYKKGMAAGGGEPEAAKRQSAGGALCFYCSSFPSICQISSGEASLEVVCHDLARLLTQTIRLRCRYPGDWGHAASRKALARRRGMGT